MMMEASGGALFVVVGCSRGFGEAVVLEAAQTLRHQRKHFVLVGKSEDGMRSIEKKIEASCKHGGSGSTVSFAVCRLDLRDEPSSIEKAFMNSLERTTNAPISYDTMYVVLNSGIATPIGPLATLETQDVAESVHINFTAFTILTCVLLRFLKSRREKEDIIQAVRIINVSSLLAQLPQATISLYCSTKAAREMVMSVLASEAPDLGCKSLKCLSWRPGPMETEMMAALRDSHQTALQWFTLMPSEKFITPRTSAKRLWNVVEADQYESGACLDALHVVDK